MIRQAKLGDFLAKRSRGIVPACTPDETFELYSVPAFETKRPEVLTGAEIGSNKQIVEPGTVLLCKINPRINRAWTVGSFTKHQKIASTEWITFPPHPDVEPRYLAHYLSRKEIRDYLAANASGVGGSLMRVKAATVEDLLLPLPKVDAQHRIVAELEKQFSRLDEAVANLKRVEASLKRYKAAILKAAVTGRLVPLEDLLARREKRSYENGNQLMQRIVKVRRALTASKGKYKEPTPVNADLPEQPLGWTWATIESLTTKVSDGVHKKPVYRTSGVPFVTVKNLTAGEGISFEKLNYISEEDHREFCKRTHPEKGDLLLSKDGTLGVVRLVNTDRAFSIFVSVALVKPVLKEMSRYLEIALESPVLQEQMVPKGSGLQHIHLEDLRQDCVPVPPLSEQRRIVAEVDRRLSIVREVEADVDSNLKRAQALRQTVLARAFLTQQ